MEKRSTIDAEKIHLFHMEIREFNIDNESFKNSDEHQLNIGHRLLHNLEDKRMKLDISCSFRNHKEEQLLHLDTDFHFQIENLQDFYSINENSSPTFSINLVATLLGIAISTIRGILYEKLANEGISDIIIPVISPIKMLQKQ